MTSCPYGGWHGEVWSLITQALFKRHQCDQPGIQQHLELSHEKRLSPTPLNTTYNQTVCFDLSHEKRLSPTPMNISYTQSCLFRFWVSPCSLFFNYRAEAILDEPWYWSKIIASLFVFCQWLSLGNNIKCSQIVAGAPWLGSPLFVFVLILGLIGSERTLTLVVHKKIQAQSHKYDL